MSSSNQKVPIDLVEAASQAEVDRIVKKKRKKNAARQRKYQRKKRKERKKAMTAADREAARRRRSESAKMSQKAIAQRELAKRELARRHLLPFIHRFYPEYQAGWFHKDLCLRLEQFLEDVIAQKSPRLMLFVPPRHGKSLTASQMFEAWALGKHPHLEFICTSYAESLQLDFSKAVQRVMREREYQLLFPGVTIPKGHEAASRWSVGLDGKLSGGGMLAAGVGGPMTGRGAHIGVIDDPVKNAEEADSEVTREGHKNWFSSTFYTRLAPGAGILVIQTRWHDDDLSGWLLHQMEEAEKEYNETGIWPADADKWEVVRYSALATEDEKYRKVGDALHPERYGVDALLKIKRTLIPRHWSALYQQEPVAEEGAYFTKAMLRTYRTRPSNSQLDIFIAGDLAISQRETADFTVFIVGGIDKNDNLWILDARRGRWNTDEIVDQIFELHEIWKPKAIGIERDKVAIAIGPVIERRKRKERKYNLIIEDLHIGGRDKIARARPMQGRMGLGQVIFPESALWTGQCFNELLRFPQGVHDDFVDALAWLAQMLTDRIWQNRTHKKKKKSWKDTLNQYIGGRRSSGAMGA